MYFSLNYSCSCTTNASLPVTVKIMKIFFPLLTLVVENLKKMLNFVRGLQRRELYLFTIINFYSNF